MVERQSMRRECPCGQGSSEKVEQTDAEGGMGVGTVTEQSVESFAGGSVGWKGHIHVCKGGLRHVHPDGARPASVVVLALNIDVD